MLVLLLYFFFFSFNSAKLKKVCGSITDPKAINSPLLPLLHGSQDVRSRKPLQTLSSALLDEKKRKGLWFLCNEMYDFGQKCSKKQLYQVKLWPGEITEEEEDGLEEFEGEPKEEEIVEEAHISVHSMSCLIPNYQTMWVPELHCKIKIHVKEKHLLHDLEF